MKFFNSPLFRVIVSVISFVLIIYLSRDIYTLWKRRDIIRERENTLRKLEQQNSLLQQELTQAQSPTFIERTARDKLGLVKSGEDIVLVPTGAASSSGERPHEFLSSWKQWLQLFF